MQNFGVTVMRWHLITLKIDKKNQKRSSSSFLDQKRYWSLAECSRVALDEECILEKKGNLNAQQIKTSWKAQICHKSVKPIKSCLADLNQNQSLS